MDFTASFPSLESPRKQQGRSLLGMLPCQYCLVSPDLLQCRVSAAPRSPLRATLCCPALTRREGAGQGHIQPFCPDIFSLIAMMDTEFQHPETSFIFFGLDFWKKIMFTSDWLRTSVKKVPGVSHGWQYPQSPGFWNWCMVAGDSSPHVISLWERHRDSGASVRADLSLRIHPPWWGELGIFLPAGKKYWGVSDGPQWAHCHLLPVSHTWLFSCAGLFTGSISRILCWVDYEHLNLFVIL